MFQIHIRQASLTNFDQVLSGPVVGLTRLLQWMRPADSEENAGPLWFLAAH